VAAGLPARLHMAQMVLPSSLSSKCYNRQPDLATSTTASPMSEPRGPSHRLWADILDDEDDSSIEWGEERMLPETMLTSSEPGTPSRHSQDGDHCADLVQSMCCAVLNKESSTLNAYAAEFLPTLSMRCPLVGICDVIAEGDEAKGCLEDAAFSEPLLVAFAPVRALPAEGPKQSSSQRFWRKDRDPSLEVRPRVPQGIHREEITDETLQRRIRNIEIGKETKEYQFYLEQIRLLRPGAEPLTPDPHNRTLSKRRWDKEVQNWRQELRKQYLDESVPEVASVASTEAEEAQSSEADDTTTVNSDDTSSQHW